MLKIFINLFGGKLKNTINTYLNICHEEIRKNKYIQNKCILCLYLDN